MKRKVLTLFLALSVLLTGIMPGWEETAQAEEGPIEVQVSRISGSNRYTTSAEIAERVTQKADKVIVASGENYPDALVSAPLSMKGNFPILLTAKNSLDPRVKTQLQALAPEEVVIAGGEGAVSSQVEKEIQSLTSGKITRIGGENRYQTATLFKEYWEKTFGQDAKITLVDGNNYPDALSAAGLIYEEGSLLLAGPGQTPDHVDLVIGGDKAVPGYPGIRRIAGEDRFATAVEIAKAAEKSSVILVDGKNFPDALSAAALAKKEGASILLVSGTHLPKPVQSYLEENKPTKVTIVGGENAVSKEIEKEIVPCIRGELHQSKPSTGNSTGQDNPSTKPNSNPLIGNTGDPLKAKYLGNSDTKKFHWQSCSRAKKILPKNQVGFSSREEAIKNGFVPCKVCEP